MRISFFSYLSYTAPLGLDLSREGREDCRFFALTRRKDHTPHAEAHSIVWMLDKAFVQDTPAK